MAFSFGTNSGPSGPAKASFREPVSSFPPPPPPQPNPNPSSHNEIPFSAAQPPVGKQQTTPRPQRYILFCTFQIVTSDSSKFPPFFFLQKVSFVRAWKNPGFGVFYVRLRFVKLSVAQLSRVLSGFKFSRDLGFSVRKLCIRISSIAMNILSMFIEIMETWGNLSISSSLKSEILVEWRHEDCEEPLHQNSGSCGESWGI